MSRALRYPLRDELDAYLQSTGTHRVVGVAHWVLSILCLCSVFSNADAAPAGSTGPGNGVVQGDQTGGGCGDLLFNADGTYENGYCWQYGGTSEPNYGAFAECYDFSAIICSIVFDFTATGTQAGQTLDAYVWEDDRGEPGAVICTRTDVDPGPVALWPSLSRHVVDFDCETDGRFWVGYWGDWPNQACGWYVGADTDGFGGCPKTLIPPGIGFPNGWQHVSVAWGPTQAIAIGVEGTFGVGELGACCSYTDGSCTLTLGHECSAPDTFLGQGSVCDPNPCDQRGACCNNAGSCRFVFAVECDGLDDSFLGDNIPCTPNPCPQIGACCDAAGGCSVLLEEDCLAQGDTFLGIDVPCDPNPCVGTYGACCVDGEICDLAFEAECAINGGEFLGGTCAPDPCLGGSGACCFEDGSCEIIFESNCVSLSGNYLGGGTSCDPNPCPQPIQGACCASDGSCLVTYDFECENDGGIFDGGSCEAAPCAELVGACCVADGVCVVHFEEECGRLGGTYAGGGTSCDPNPCPEPCPPFRLAGRSSETVPAPPFDPFVSGNTEQGPNRGGTLILHYNPGVVFTGDPCGSSNLSTCADALDRVDSENPVVGFVLAAFAENANPRLKGVSFGIDYDECVTLLDWQACADFELVTNGWPAPGSGNAVTFAETEETRIVELYSFELQGMSATPGELRLTEHPTQGAFFADDSVPAKLDAVAGLGSLGFFFDGTSPCPEPQETFGACCQQNGDCTITAVGECDGIYFWADTSCDPSPCGPTERGACCFVDGSCLLLLRTECVEGNGFWSGEGVECNESTCPPPGACCFGDNGSCVELFLITCLDLGGSFQGVDTVCDPNPCPIIGTCCFSNGTCRVELPEDCTHLGGTYVEEGGDCDPNPCPQPPEGACCLADGRCLFIDVYECATYGGTFNEGVECEPNPCPQPPDGACCFDDGSCQFLDIFECNDLDGDSWTEDASCDPNPCPQLGACCFDDGHCELLLPEPCSDDGGTYSEGTCDPNPCPEPPNGACCFVDGSCQFVNAFECNDLDGDSWIEGAVCDPNPCPQPPQGACCFQDGSCLFVDVYECSELGGSSWTEGVTCESEPCPVPEFGACCLSEEDCVELFDYECDAQGGRFKGAGTVCDEVVCRPPCNEPLAAGRVPKTTPSRGVNAGGSLILALSEGTVYTEDTDDYCGTATSQKCGNAVDRVDTNVTVVINVLAAFNPGGAPRLAGVTFGVHYGACIVITDWGGCGDFELGTSTWPDPGEGTAVTWTEAQESTLTEVYWFAAYGYTDTPGQLCLIPHPTQGANFADDSIPSELDAIAGLGCFGFYTDGDVPCPISEGIGACCYGPNDCADGLSQSGCESGGGEYGGDGSSCSDPGFCEGLPLGACCLDDGTCVDVDRDTCNTLVGDYQGDGTDCQVIDCSPVPTIESSWGEIKSRFRDQKQREGGFRK